MDADGVRSELLEHLVEVRPGRAGVVGDDQPAGDVELDEIRSGLDGGGERLS
jgi:hypothetical protein